MSGSNNINQTMSGSNNRKQAKKVSATRHASGTGNLRSQAVANQGRSRRTRLPRYPPEHQGYRRGILRRGEKHMLDIAEAISLLDAKKNPRQPVLNPLTGRKIKVTSNAYQRLMESARVLVHDGLYRKVFNIRSLNIRNPDVYFIQVPELIEWRKRRFEQERKDSINQLIKDLKEIETAMTKYAQNPNIREMEERIINEREGKQQQQQQHPSLTLAEKERLFELLFARRMADRKVALFDREEKQKKDIVVVIKDIQTVHLWNNPDAVHVTINVKPITLTEITLDAILAKTREMSEQIINPIEAKHPGNIEKYVRVFFRNELHTLSKVVHPDMPAAWDNFRNDLQVICNRSIGASYVVDFTEITVNVTVRSVRGGCNEGKTTVVKYLEESIANQGWPQWYKDNHTIELLNLKGINNNCLFRCFNEFYGIPGNRLKADTVRRELGIPLNVPVEYSLIPKISEYYNRIRHRYYTSTNTHPNRLNKLDRNVSFGYQLIGANYKPLLFSHPCLAVLGIDASKDASYIHLFLWNDHYYLFNTKTPKVKCKCGVRLLVTNTTHVCNPTKSSYYRTQVLGEKRVFASKKDRNPSPILGEHEIVHWDLETLTNETKTLVPYLSGWYDVNLESGNRRDGTFRDGFRYKIGPSCLDETVTEFMKYKNRIISAYNGSRFDFHFLMRKLNERGVEVSNMILTNGKLISFQFGDGNKIFDMCLFLMTSLADACEGYQIQNSKTSFDHKLIKTWDDVKTYAYLTIPYNKMDVLALKELFEKCNNEVHIEFKKNLTDYVSVGHMAYAQWAIDAHDQEIEIPDKDEKYECIKEGTFGARTYPQIQEFKSIMYNELIEKYDQDKIILDSIYVKLSRAKEKLRTLTPDEKKAKKLRELKEKELNLENIKLYERLKTTGSFLRLMDIKSLYPAAMRGTSFCKIRYPKGPSRWSTNPSEEFNAEKLGFYKVKYTCTRKDLRVPILPKRILTGTTMKHISWDLHDGEAVFTNVDIENAKMYGYTVEFVGKCLVYDEYTEELFSKYIDRMFGIKEAEDRKGINANVAKRNFAKLLQNALYGKTLQKAIFDDTQLVTDIFQYHDFIATHRLTDFVFANGQLMVTGTHNDKQAQIKKPCQLGAFVTAYSRRIMLHVMSTIDPLLKSRIFTYTDTDCAHVTEEGYRKLVAAGLIKDELGHLCSDLKGEGLIFFERNLAPKTYILYYINDKGEIHAKDTAHMKAKGIPKDVLSDESFLSDHEVVLEFESLLKKTTKLSKADIANEVKHFSIILKKTQRTLSKTPWTGMDLINGDYYPKGYIMTPTT